jgi:calcium-dependent protein kinase
MTRRDLITKRRRPLTFHYTVGEPIGVGGFGTVYAATHNMTGIQRAVKKIDRASVTCSKAFEDEIDCLIELDHPNIIKLVEYFEDDEAWYLVFEVCTGKDLLDLTLDAFSNHGAGLSEDHICVAMVQMINAVIGCRSHGIIHRDIKPDNFMIANREKQGTRMQIKMIDVGLASHRFDEKELSDECGTPCYMAPEVLKGKYGHQCDMWSLGVTFYAMLTGDLLFDDEKGRDKLLKDISDKKFVKKQLDRISRKISPSALDLLRKMLTHDPGKRISASQAMQHPFIVRAQKIREAHLQEFDIDNECSLHLWERMEHYADMPALKRIATELVAHLVTDQETLQQRRTFRKIDTNGDGVASVEELTEFIKAEHVPPPEQMEQVLSVIAGGHVEYLTYTKFLAATLPKQQLSNGEYIMQVFRLLDLQRNGKIDFEDLRLFFHNPVSDMQLSAMIKEVDMEGKGYLNFEDFKKMMACSS